MPTIVLRILNILSHWFVEHGFRILIIFLIARFVDRFSKASIERIIRKMVVADVNRRDKEAEKKREDTLIEIFSKSIKVFIWLLALLMILQEFGIAISPLLAGAGVAGLAFGFGGQYLIRDLISGLFIILENQYRIGDVVCFGETCGTVEDMTLRMTILRDLDGTVHYVPHGEIKKVANFSKEFAMINLNIGISYDADLEKVIDVINNVGKDLAEDKNWKEYILEKPHFARVKDFADSSIIVKILGRTKPLKQWDVAGEFRKRLKLAFDKEGIEIPFPQVVIHQGKS